jgi:hypothetical protein
MNWKYEFIDITFILTLNDDTLILTLNDVLLLLLSLLGSTKVYVQSIII